MNRTTQHRIATRSLSIVTCSNYRSFFFFISLETADSLAAAAAVSAVSFVVIGTEGGGGEAGTASVFNITELASRCYWFR